MQNCIMQNCIMQFCMILNKSLIDCLSVLQQGNEFSLLLPHLLHPRCILQDMVFSLSWQTR